jgi:YHS domain-containing protein
LKTKKGRDMKRYITIICIIAAGLLTVPSFAQEKTETAKENKSVVEKGKPVNIVCPVSAEDIDEDITYEYKGVTYALCCKSCLKKFKADPEKYISRLSEDGKSIKKNKGDKK